MCVDQPYRSQAVARHAFKTSGIARSGFEYQDLIGIDVLLRFYRDPNLFHWVELEAEDAKAGKLDDVIAARRDNSFELLQVKFTADADRYFLDWDWLLTKKGRGSSLLKKWSAALETVKALGPVHSAKLRTNRRPSADVAKALNDNFIDFDRIGVTHRKLVATELGGEKAARTFFKQFEFSHSELLIDDLEAQLKGEIVPTDTDNTGWLLLREQARRWSVRKNDPEPNGRIQHKHLVQIITKSRPKPIPQDFEIPALYQVPVKAFDIDFLHRIEFGNHPVSVLWGTPGRGKSTYLSYLVSVLAKKDTPVIRHHYFLSLEDSTTDRISFLEICTSLMEQMSGRYTEAIRGLEYDSNQIRKWLEACGAYYLKQNKRFYVVIDGLDHVWRERRNTSQMEHLFNFLLPCPPNVFLIVGTQRVSTDQLPLKLIQNAGEHDWIEVPPMDEDAVHAWVAGQYKHGRLLLRDAQPFRGVTELSEISQAFFSISNGNPLHLIYSFEALVRRGVVVTADEVKLLPACPDGDIRKYYAGLWGRLTSSAKRVVHLVAGSDFLWPADGLRKCAGSLDQVDHLLEHRRTGLMPFHGSILAYAREQAEHAEAFKEVLPAVVQWLKVDAPEYWRWAWLWIMQARLGDVSDLLNETTRQWVIESLSIGWPAEQIVTILGDAELRAFGQGDYSRTLELRSMKIRVENGQTLQTNRFNDFEESAIRAAKNQQQLLNLADSVSSLSDDAIITIVRCLDGKEQDRIGYECYEELRRQVNMWISLRHRRDEEFLSLAENFIEALVDFGVAKIPNLLGFIYRFHARDRVFATLLRNLTRARKFEIALATFRELSDPKYEPWRSPTQDALVRISSIEGIDLKKRLRKLTTVSPLLACWYRIKGLEPPARLDLSAISADAVRDNYDYGPNVAVNKFFHSFFFASLDTALTAIGECSPALIGIDRKKLGWMSDAIEVLWDAAFDLAKRPSKIDFGSIFLCLADLAPIDKPYRPSEAGPAQYRGFRSAVRRIAADLHALKCTLEGPVLVGKESFELARGSTHWLDEQWIENELEVRTRIFEPEGVHALIDDVAAYADQNVTQFSERAERWTDLAQLAVLYGHEGASGFVSRAADCIVGYGWRKDVWIFDVLSAIEAVHTSGAADVVPWLKTLAPLVDQMTVFTDGDETNHAPEEFIDLVADVHPAWLPDLYRHYIAKEEWRLAENTLAGVLESADLKHAVGTALAGTLLEKSDLYALEKLRDKGKPNADSLLKKQRAMLGIVGKPGPPVSSAKAKRNKDDFARSGRPPDISKFGAIELERLLKRVASPKLGYEHREDALRAWMKHWGNRGKGLDVLRSLNAHFLATDNPHDIEAMLDDAFGLSLEYEGKAKAYVWLVRAHVERRGWSYYWDNSGRVEKRLQLAAKYYKSRWAEFIRDTSAPARYWARRRPGLTVGTRWLVRFLLLAGQQQKAVAFTDTMVRLTMEELHDQPLAAAGWTP